MKYPKIPLAQTVVQLFKAKNIKHIVISPGSRNAPLTIGFTNDPFFKCYSIVDERSAGFFALGIAQQLQQPTAVVCTSGSALLNYYPAISEAFYSDIPLVVLSADRPKHLVGIGDGQTINQKNVFVNHILYSASLKLDLKDELNLSEQEELPIFKNLEDKLERFLGLQDDIQSHNEEEINTALNLAVHKSGPVHINVPFDEPLYELTDKLIVKPQVQKFVEKDKKKIEKVILEECLVDWNESTRKMILVGANHPHHLDEKWVDELSNDNSVLVFTETISNIHNEEFFPSIDKIIAPLTDEEFKKLQPDILITFGGLIVSKKIKAFLRKYQPKHHWHIDKKTANDTFFVLEKHIETTPNHFFSEFLPKITHVIKSDYQKTWRPVKLKRQLKHLEYLRDVAFSDLKVFDVLLESLPQNSILQLGNSSAVRYAQLFDLDPTIEVFCNRGTSGIDGSTSTAVGCAAVNEKQTIFITGDLSFIYDSNGLWNNYIPKNFRTIIINNQGGGIFRILPGHKNTENFDTFFETKHDLTSEHLAKMYGFEYDKASNEDELSEVLKDFFGKSVKPRILEIFTPRTKNDEILLSYFEFIK
ncbi:MAG: thiamine pyrophosphate-binding protein [Gelidibacter sp.]